jgi:PKD repeat protein
MKKLINLALALLISAAAFAQGYNVEVCVTITGPQPNGPVVANLTYYNNGSTYTMLDTLYIQQLPYTHCFQSYMQLPDSGFFAYANGFVYLSTCAPTQIYNFSQAVSSNTTITVNAQNCQGGNNCTASLTQNPGTTILTANSTGTAPYTYSWDGGITFTSSAQFPMTTPGTYCVTVMDATGCTATDCFTYSPNPGCQAIIDIQGSGPYVLSAFGTGVAPLSYDWSTGEISQVISVTSTGIYCLYVTDANGCVDSTCVYLTVGSNNCSANIIENVDFTGASYLAAIGDTNNYSSLNYTWSYNGVTINNNNSQFLYPNAPGQYCISIDHDSICTATYCYTFNPGNPVGGCSVYTSAIQDSVNSNLYYMFAYPTGTPPFTYDWIFSNGTVSTNAYPTVLYNNNSGVNWAEVTVTDATGCSSSYSLVIPVTPPSGNCYSGFSSYSNYQFGNPGEVFFQSYLLNALPSGASYSWDFGDGSSSTLENPTHTYASTGFYNVCLTTNYNGCTYTSCNSEYVDLAWWSNNPFQGNCSAGFMILSSPSSSNGLINIINTSQGNNLFYTWSFGNGFISNNPLPFTTINNAGIYEICVSILDTVNGCGDTFCDTITIDSLGNVYRSAMSGNVGILVSGAPQPNALLTTVDVKDASSDISIVPNPSNGIFNINTNWMQGSSVVDIIDLTGNIVQSKTINTTKGQKTVSLDIQDVANGTYLVRVVSNQRVQTVKLLVNH